MLERLVKLLEEFGYEYSEVETDYNTKVIVSRLSEVDGIARLNRVVIIMCDNGMIIKDGEDYCIVHSPWEVIDVLDCIL